MTWASDYVNTGKRPAMPDGKTRNNKRSNTMNEEPIYVGRGKTSKYGVRMSLCLSDIPKEHITTSNNGKKYINLELNEKRQPDTYGNTHSIKVDTWKPGQAQTPAPRQQAPQPAADNDLPF